MPNNENPHYLDTWGDHLLLLAVTGGLYLLFCIGCLVYVGIRAFIRRYVKKMPDWSDF